MKKVFTLLSLIFVSLCSMTIFIGCSKGKDKDKSNNNQPDYNIQINADMFQTQYKIGQPFKMVSNTGGKSNKLLMTIIVITIGKNYSFLLIQILIIILIILLHFFLLIIHLKMWVFL